MEAFRSPAPEVRLERAFSEPFKNFLATAKTCYSGRGVVGTDQIDDSERNLALAESLYQAGHHTTLQHAHFQFSMSNVSRQFVWSFLHSHPFYNSEQVSQRYVSVREGNYAVPPMPAEAEPIYRQAAENQMEAYRRLVQMLGPETEHQFLKRFPGRKPDHPVVVKSVKKKAQEVARYVLPVATFAYLYHTISGITLLRYWRMCEQYDAPAEQRLVVKKMVELLLEHDPLYERLLEEPLLLEETTECQFLDSRGWGGEGCSTAFIEEFDQSLEGRVSRLVDFSAKGEKVLAASVREVLGLSCAELSDEEAVDLVMNPARNRTLGEKMNCTTHSKLSRALYHVSYTFRKKLSHTADSQDQRHRMTPASRPILARHLSEAPDYIVPTLIRQVPQAEAFYRKTMEQTWEAMNRLKALGVKEEFRMYLLPNAAPIRFTESSDLLNLRHKMVMRLCYNAQEEIWRASVDETEQILEQQPGIGRYLLPPCGVRKLAGARPYCPEGDRFCGERVWLYELKDYERVI